MNSLRTEKEWFDWYRTGLDQTCEIIRTSPDIRTFIKSLTEFVIRHFQADRSFLIYPCDPQAPSFRVPVESTVPEFPGGMETGIEIPMTNEQRSLMETLQHAEGVVFINEDSMDRLRKEDPGFQSHGIVLPRAAMLLAIRPPSDKMWGFGIHECAGPREWHGVEVNLFEDIGKRLGEALEQKILYSQLRKREKHYRTLVESPERDYFFYTLDGEGRITYLSPSFKTVTGYSSQNHREWILDYAYKGPDPIIGGLLQKESEIYHQETIQGKRNGPYELAMEHASGSRLSLRITEVPVYNDLGEQIGVEGIAHDITETRFLRESLLDLNRDLQVKINEEIEKNQWIGEQLIQLNEQTFLGSFLESLSERWTRLKPMILDQNWSLEDSLLEEPPDNPLNGSTGFEDGMGLLTTTFDLFRSRTFGEGIRETFHVEETLTHAVQILSLFYDRESLAYRLDPRGVSLTIGYKKALLKSLVFILKNIEDVRRCNPSPIGIGEIPVEINREADGSLLLDLKLPVDSRDGLEIQKILGPDLASIKTPGWMGRGFFLASQILERWFPARLSTTERGYLCRIRLPGADR